MMPLGHLAGLDQIWGRGVSPSEGAGGGIGVPASNLLLLLPQKKEICCKQKSLVFATLCCLFSIRRSCLHPPTFCFVPRGPQTLLQPFTKAQPTPHYFPGRWGYRERIIAQQKQGAVCCTSFFLKISTTMPGDFSLGVSLPGPSV